MSIRYGLKNNETIISHSLNTEGCKITIIIQGRRIELPLSFENMKLILNALPFYRLDETS